MLDNQGRNIRYLRLSVTDRCNFRCRYCMPAEGVCKREHSEMLSFEELTEIVRTAVSLGVSKVRLTGGEPLVRRGIVDLCRSLRAINGVRELTMTTNGALLPQYAAELKQAGVDRLNISLDTLNKDKFASLTRGGSLADTLAGLDAARHAGFRGTKLNAVLLGGVNEDEIPALAQLAQDREFEVRFIELMPIGECADWPRERFLSADAVLHALPERVCTRPQSIAVCRCPAGRKSVWISLREPPFLRPTRPYSRSTGLATETVPHTRWKIPLHGLLEINQPRRGTLRGHIQSESAYAIRATE